MIRPVAYTWDVIGKRRQLAGNEVSKREPTRIDVSSVPVDEVHRNIEHIVGVTLEAETRFKDKRQGAAAVRIGIGPYMAAVAEKTRRPSVDERRVGEQGHDDRL